MTYILIIFWYGDFAAQMTTIPNLTEKECKSLERQIVRPAGKLFTQCLFKNKD